MATLSDVIRVLSEHHSGTTAGSEIRRLVTVRGSINACQQDCNAIAAHSGNNYLLLLWPYYKSHLATILRMVRLLDMNSNTGD